MDAVISFFVSLVALVVPGFGGTAPPQYSGYVEADYLYVASASGGVIDAIAVTDGDVVAEGALLFSLRYTQQLAVLRGAEARVIAAEASLENLATGEREDELAVVRASLARAEAEQTLARETATRTAKLFDEGLVPQAKLDQARATLASADAQVRQLAAQLKVSELPARAAQRAQAEANLVAARADADKARSDLDERTVLAPQAGRVEQVFFDAGEVGAAGAPVVALLPVHALKVKFYMPEADRPSFALGDRVDVRCDGCAEGIAATVTRFASEPQFTPPVIYSRSERQRLSFLVEAVLDGEAALPPGQPVTIETPE
ncbi:HlyD family secretion protein [Devosia sp.]|uniref:HlyD family secretion protein n=1 Tax=Devosia sp. TaxID=1871048 RepID=UPI003A95886A